jgi:hypothetical protein
MKTIFKLINLLLCFELIIGPWNPNLSFFGQEVFAETCGTGLQFDSTLNRCLTTMDAANVMKATATCPQDDVECYKNNATTALKGKEDSGAVKKAVGSNSGFVSTVMNAAAVAVPVTMAVQGLSGANSSCASASYWALVGGGVALFVGDNLANFQHKKRLKKIEGDWASIAKADAATETDIDQQKVNATESQSQAFEMLARSEDSLANAASMKSKFFGVAMGAFGVATALSLFEMSNPLTTATGICKSTASGKEIPLLEHSDLAPIEIDKSFLEKLPDIKSSSISNEFHNYVAELKSRRQKIYNLKNASNISDLHLLHKEYLNESLSPSLDEAVLVKSYMKDLEPADQNVFAIIKMVALKAFTEMNPLPKAVAGELVNVAVTGAATAAGYAFREKLPTFLMTPAGRASVGGVLFGWSAVMFNHASSQAKASKNRADLLRKMRDEFKTASGAINMCAPADRSDPAKPECYCYSSDGSRNSNRATSQTCQKLFNGTSSVGTITSLTSNAAVVGCIDSSRQFDETCKCKSANSCMKVGQGSLVGLSTGTLSTVTTGLAPLAALSNGTLESTNLSAATLGSNALKIMDANKNLENKILTPKQKDDKAKLTAAFQNSAMQAGAGVPSNLLGSSSGLPTNPGEAALMLEKDLKETATNSSSVNRSGETVGISSGNEKSTELEFGLTNEQAAAQETQIAEVMKENLDYGTNDINKGPSTNIFEVLTNRYQRSGMRRLFDEKGKTKADVPSTTDVTQ